MLQLPNGCRCSELSIHPQSWKTGGISLLKRDWYIQYYFYDPVFQDIPKPKSGKLIIVKGGINRYKTLIERRDHAQDLLEHTKDKLLNGFNPVTKSTVLPQTENPGAVSPSTPLFEALWFAHGNLKRESHTLTCIKSALAIIERTARTIRLYSMPVGETRLKHIRVLLDSVQKARKLSACSYNHYRSYLMMLFKELKQFEAVDHDPAEEVAKQATVKKIRKVLTAEQRTLLNNNLRRDYYNFWRYMQVFFHSGARSSELFALTKELVNLKEQRIKYLVKKGKQQREVYRPIKDSVLELWTEMYNECPAGGHFFGRGFAPALTSMQANRVPKVWKKIMKAYRLDATFYSLKHSNSTEVVSILDNEDAAKLNAHTSTAMVVNIYDVGREERQMQRLKKVDNKFA